MVASPEVSRLVSEFEWSYVGEHQLIDRHHEQTPARQKSFAQHVKTMVNIMQYMGNPHWIQKMS